MKKTFREYFLDDRNNLKYKFRSSIRELTGNIRKEYEIISETFNIDKKKEYKELSEKLIRLDSKKPFSLRKKGIKILFNAIKNEEFEIDIGSINVHYILKNTCYFMLIHKTLKRPFFIMMKRKDLKKLKFLKDEVKLIIEIEDI